MNEPAPQLILASASPRRHDLLRQIGLVFSTRVPEVDEQPHPGEDPGALAIRLASDKAAAVLRQVGDAEVVLAADTVVCVDGVSLGKPADAAAAVAMLSRLSGREHTVVTAVAVGRGDEIRTAVSTTRVWMRDLEASEIERYAASGEPLDKAGAYAIQGRAAAFVTRIEGSYSGVVGLPLSETLALLASFGVRP